GSHECLCGSRRLHFVRRGPPAGEAAVRMGRTLRDRLIVAAILPVCLMAVTAVFTAYTVTTAIAGVDALFEKNYFIQELLVQTGAAKTNLSAYMATKNSENLRR